jgi:hypothetical protein
MKIFGAALLFSAKTMGRTAEALSPQLLVSGLDRLSRIARYKLLERLQYGEDLNCRSAGDAPDCPDICRETQDVRPVQIMADGLPAARWNRLRQRSAARFPVEARILQGRSA